MMKRCDVAGCTNEAYTDRKGRQFKQCQFHRHMAYADGRRKRELMDRERQALQSQVHVLVVDWNAERLLHVTGLIMSVEPFPATHGDLMRIMAQAARAGQFVAKQQAYKDSDISGDES